MVLFSLMFMLSSDSATFFQTFEYDDYMQFLLVALVGTFGAVCKSWALQFEQVSRIVILNYLQIIFVLIVDVYLF